MEVSTHARARAVAARSALRAAKFDVAVVPTPSKRSEAAAPTRAGASRTIAVASIVIGLDAVVALPALGRAARFHDTNLVPANLTASTRLTANTAVLSVVDKICTSAVAARFTCRATGIPTTEKALVADKAASPIGASRHRVGPNRAHIPTGTAVLRIVAEIIANGTAEGESCGTAADTFAFSCGWGDP